LKLRLFKKHFLLICIVLAILVSLGVIARQIVIAQSNNNRTLPDPFSQDIQTLQKELEKDLNSEDRENLEEKLEILYAQATQREIGIQQLTSIPEPDTTYQIPTIVLSGTRQTGIIEHPSVPFSSTDFLIENAWQELIGKNYVLIFAGALTSDPQQGVLLVLTDSPHQTLQIWTPEKRGSVRIVEVKNLQLGLISQSGDLLYFDVPGRKFITELGEIVPTITPGAESILTSTEPAGFETAYP
jgi:hypothetical protein